jgi:outer membrane protein
MMKKINLILAAILLVIGFGVNNAAEAQVSDEVTIGYVNPQAILANMPEMRAVQQRIQNFAVRKQQELLEKEQAFQVEVANYQDKISVISAEAQAAEEERLGQLQTELLQAQQTAEEELEARRQELIGPLLEQIGNAITTVAQRMELTYVLNTTTSTGDLVILYASEEYSERYNITEEVMAELGMF